MQPAISWGRLMASRLADVSLALGAPPVCRASELESSAVSSSTGAT